MLVQIGKRRTPHHDLVENLLDCHGRIRHFTELATKLASATALSPDEVRATAAEVERYFRDSLPLHACDEEESILPRLRGQDAILDEALDRMTREHDEHDPLVASLLEIVQGMVAEPSSWAARKQQLSMLSRALEEHFDAHLASEEQLVFPAVSMFLSGADKSAIAMEMAKRRDGPPDTSTSM